MRILVTGGAGFTGSAVCRYLVARRGATVLNVDKLTAASNLASLDPIASSPRYRWSRADICDRSYIAALMQAFAPDAVIHLAGPGGGAADQAGDRNAVTDMIDPASVGTWSLLAASSEYLSTLPQARRDRFRFVQSVGADIVPPAGQSTAEPTANRLALLWQRLYGLPVIVARSAALYGPCQALDAMVPQLVLAADAGMPMAVAGTGARSRDWLHVDDHARALEAMLLRGTPGTAYQVGARQSHSDLAVARRVAQVMDRYAPDSAPHNDLITFVANETAARHDAGIDPSMLERDTGWQAAENFDTGIARTAHWYLENPAWWRPLRSARFDAGLLGQRRLA